MAELMQAVKSVPHDEGSIRSATKPSGMLINGVNIMQIPSRDAYSFGLQIMDVLFSKEELGSSLLFQSKKSSKPGLDAEKVAQLLKCVQKRYKDSEWDMKTLTSKANQKM
jgi:hypothetical protein